MSSRASLDVRAFALFVLAWLVIVALSMTATRAKDAGWQSMTTDTQREVSRPEILMGFRIVGPTLYFRVATGGCTKADDFRVDVEHPSEPSGPVTLELHRTRIDSCKGYFPDGTEITFDIEALGIPPAQSIVVRNPFGAHGGQ